jgi:putative NADPH-quinone reductase
MGRMKIALLQGHPDTSAERFCAALAAAYAAGAKSAGHELQEIRVAALDFPWLKSKHDFESGPLPAVLEHAQATLAWADHLVIVYPLWLGDVPAVLKAFLEQTLRPGFAFPLSPGQQSRRALQGKTARVIVTMGMPAPVYRWYFGAHSLRSLRRSVLGFVGVRPTRALLIGSIEAVDAVRRAGWLAKVEQLGRAAR